MSSNREGRAPSRSSAPAICQCRTAEGLRRGQAAKDTANAGHADRGGDVLLVQGAPGAARKREINRVDIFAKFRRDTDATRAAQSARNSSKIGTSWPLSQNSRTLPSSNVRPTWCIHDLWCPVKRSFDDHITGGWRQQRHRRERRRGALIARKLDPHLESQTAHAKTSMKAVCCRSQLASRDLGETLAHRVQHHGKPR